MILSALRSTARLGSQMKRGIEFATGAPDSYFVYVVNTSNWVIYAIVNESGTEIPVTPNIGRTCTTDLQTCKDNGNYALLTSAACSAAPFRFKIRATHPPTGKRGETGWNSVQPDCAYPGEVSQFDQPDPAS